MLARFTLASLAVALLTTGAAAQTSLIIENFNVDEGDFTWAPTTSGSTNNIAASSTAEIDATMALEGASSQALVLDATTPDTTARMRHVAGAGMTANNTPFSTTFAGTDGWIGFALKTNSPGWTVSLWIELAPNEPGNPGGINNNGGLPKDVIDDGQWHIYEWNLDDDTGGPDGWGPVAGIIAGTSTVEEGNHTIDSIIFRNSNVPATSTFNLDFVALNRNGSIADIVPEPPTGDADFDGDGDVDGADFLTWQRNLGATGTGTLATGDANEDMNVDATDLTVWQAQFGPGAPAAAAVSAIPEPTTLAMAAFSALAAIAAARRR